MRFLSNGRMFRFRDKGELRLDLNAIEAYGPLVSESGLGLGISTQTRMFHLTYASDTMAPADLKRLDKLLKPIE